MRLYLCCILFLFLISVKGQSDTARIWLEKGNDCFDKGKFNTAIDCYTKAIELYHNYKSAYFNRGLAKIERGKNKEALDDFNKALELDSTNAKIYNGKATAEFHLKNFEVAIADYKKAIELNPNEGIYERNLYYLLGSRKYENRYGPFHRIIKDNANKTISKVGVYLSAGSGLSGDYQIVGFSSLYSFSVAYKSHLFTITQANSVTNNGGRDADQIQKTNYIGLLVGESVRYKHAMVSISSGVALSNVYINSNWMPFQNNYDYKKQDVFSVPIEFKAFWLANNYIGVGTHISKNIIPAAAQFSPFYFGFSIVTGFWNIPKKLVNPSTANL